MARSWAGRGAIAVLVAAGVLALFGPHEERVELFLVDDVGSRAVTRLPLG